MSITWREFSPLILTWVPGAPWYLVEGVIRDAARELCRFAGIWEEDCVDITTEDGTQDYLLEADNDYAEVYQPQRVRYLPTGKTDWADAIDLPFQTKEWLDRSMPTWLVDEATDPTHYTLFNRGYVSLVGIPDAAGAVVNLKVRATMIPKLDSTVTDERLLDHKEAIEAKARYSLLSMPGKPWSSPSSTKEQWQLWLRGRANALYAQQRRNGPAELVAQAPQKWGTR